MNRKLVWLLACLFSLVGVAYGDVVTDWNEHLLDAVRTEKSAPPKAARAMAMVHIAVYDAVNGIEQTHEPYYVDPAAPAGASPEAAAVAAAHKVLITLFPAQQADFDAARDVSLAATTDGTAKTDGIAWGETVADAIIALRANDHSGDTVDYTPGTNPGDWQPTPPAFAAAALPQWPTVTPFAMTSGDQFRSDGPPALDSAEYTDAFNDVKDIGRADSATRTADETEIAKFWINGPGTFTPPGHWNSIAQIIAVREGNTLAENARLFALLNIAAADAAIASWDNKYTYNNWRPVTAIPAADTDGNDATQADPGWLPLIPTPAFPDYTSGHSTFSGAASKVLELYYGSNGIAFDTGGDSLPDVTRSYTSFSQAADESGRSRVYGGIHWEFSNQDGLHSGRDLGEYVFNNLLKRVQTRPPVFSRLCGILGFGNLTLMITMTLAMRFVTRRRSK